jgi:hypothetical protein
MAYNFRTTGRSLFISTCFLAFGCIAIAAPFYASAADFMDLFGVNNTVNNAAAQMQQLLDNARKAAFALEEQANEHGKERLEQVNAIADKAIASIKDLERQTNIDATELLEKINRIKNETVRQLVDIEDTTVKDLGHLIDQAECAADRTLNQNLQNALGGFGHLIGGSEIDITPPKLSENERESFCLGITSSCEIHRVFHIKQPFSETYTDIRSYLLNRLNNATELTKVSTIITTYSFIAQLAKRAGCFMQYTGYVREYLLYRDKAQQWDLALGSKVRL